MSVSPRRTVVQFGSNYVLELSAKPGVLFWTCALTVDADGSPRAYHPAGSPPGLDYIANAGKPGNWWGIATKNGGPSGTPVIQTPEDPAPGFYVSTTALQCGALKHLNPMRYVDASEVPYIVLPMAPKFSPSQSLGDLAMVFNHANGKYSWAIYADIGPSNKLGEGSMALCEVLGLSPNPKNGGTSKETIAMIYWPGSKNNWDPVLQTTALWLEWGGVTSAKLALPQINWDQFNLSSAKLASHPDAQSVPFGDDPLIDHSAG